MHWAEHNHWAEDIQTVHTAGLDRRMHEPGPHKRAVEDREVRMAVHMLVVVVDME